MPVLLIWLTNKLSKKGIKIELGEIINRILFVKPKKEFYQIKHLILPSKKMRCYPTPKYLALMTSV